MPTSSVNTAGATTSARNVYHSKDSMRYSLSAPVMDMMKAITADMVHIMSIVVSMISAP